MKKYLDQNLDSISRAKILLSELSLEEKMGQISGYFPKTSTFDDLSSEHPYGVGDVACLTMRTFSTLDDVIEMQNNLQKKIMELSPHGIPALFHMEGVFGALVTDATTFPTSIGRAASWNTDVEEKIGGIIGEEVSALGVSQVFAPVLDINRDARFGRLSETYGEDPTLASALGIAYVKGVQSNPHSSRKVDAVAKHFLGFHAGQAGIHGADTPIPDRLLQEVYAKPFQAAITEGKLKGVMPSYNSINGIPVSSSKKLLTDLLRNEMQFEGLVVADYSGIKEVHTRHRLYESLEEAGYNCLQAGLDIELPSKRCYNDLMMELFRDGSYDVELLDRAVLRILETKFRLGLFEHPFAESKKRVHEIYQQKTKEVAYQSAAESIVLLKNDGLLPLTNNPKRIVVIGYHGNTLRSMFGGYSHFSMNEAILSEENTMAGIEGEPLENTNKKLVSGSFVRDEERIRPQAEKLIDKLYPSTLTIYQELKKQFSNCEVAYAFGYGYAGDDSTFHEEALELAASADVIILTLGGKNGTGAMASMGEGIDSTSINLPPTQEVFIRKVAKLNKPTLGIHLDGRPISSDAADEHLNAIVEAWSPAEQGPKAIVDTIIGKNNPSGKLPISVAYNSGQLPLYYNHVNGSSYHQGTTSAFANTYVDLSHEPRYFFGFGHSYTTYEYSNLHLNNDHLFSSGVLSFSFEIENTGGYDGTEIPQVYIQDVAATVVRPNKELVGFKRIFLKKGEKATIHFELNESQCAFLDENMKWKVEAGIFKLLIGPSSNQILLQDEFLVTKSKFIEGSQRKFYC